MALLYLAAKMQACSPAKSIRRCGGLCGQKKKLLMWKGTSAAGQNKTGRTDDESGALVALWQQMELSATVARNTRVRHTSRSVSPTPNLCPSHCVWRRSYQHSDADHDRRGVKIQKTGYSIGILLALLLIVTEDLRTNLTQQANFISSHSPFIDYRY